MDISFAGWRILAVDDEPDNLNLLADLMEFQGAEVKRTENAQQALKVLDDYHPSLILLDLSMPGMDGWELHRQLRTRTELAHIPIIAITALAMPTDVERASHEGFDGYVTKPFRIQTLLTDIKDCVEKFASKRGDGASHPV